MNVKQIILRRIKIVSGFLIVIALLIIGKVLYIQHAQGRYWRNVGDSLNLKYMIFEAQRGTIYSEDGKVLSTTYKLFDIRMDFGADGMRTNNGRAFKSGIDSLSIQLADLFQDKSAAGYKQFLMDGYKNKDRYALLQRKITIEEYEKLRTFALIREGRLVSGLVVEVSNYRLNPFGLLAKRTIGLDRENAQKVGLERTYDSVLTGENGTGLMMIDRDGNKIPYKADDYVKVKNGHNLITTLDIFIQKVTEDALLKRMQEANAYAGCAIIMETATGKIKAIANLSKQTDSTYMEDFNYAIFMHFPGELFLVVDLMALLEDKQVKREASGLGRSRSAGGSATSTFASFKAAFEYGGGAIAIAAQNYYMSRKEEFMKHVRWLKLDSLTNIDLVGESIPEIPIIVSRDSQRAQAEEIMYRGGVKISPLGILTLYNAIANNGKIMKPYLVNAIKDENTVVKTFSPTVVNDSICSAGTLKMLQECLKGVCSNGTAKLFFGNTPYKVAGKTASANYYEFPEAPYGKRFQCSFAGYFPAENPQYTCIVVIKSVTGEPANNLATAVFREITDALYRVSGSGKGKPDYDFR
ncbi:peptidoglycan glycosyltransferase [Chitinophaga sp. SYP-B3965]|uniref:peptidoglycan D,D-transpeptidase FtsI family protein n=1 Tax=Chitinophaga sp. SYP-B3965 TaxID=2663120 RepID=UPI001299D9CF|nr:penicillin-binding transpeptidase domain-containing protein [Chitinophaga sp. SYP-B3965]MRG43727.1 peptidoglycan glycosyltransferase [Chitinophaga sp. SYP-B3965]